MSVTIRRNFGPLARDVKFSDRALMREIGLLARERIIRRTLSGKDEGGKAFHPYSPGYRAAKGSSKVNLQVSGQMLQAITIVAVDEDSVTLGFK